MTREGVSRVVKMATADWLKRLTINPKQNKYKELCIASPHSSISIHLGQSYKCKTNSL